MWPGLSCSLLCRHKLMVTCCLCLLSAGVKSLCHYLLAGEGLYYQNPKFKSNIRSNSQSLECLKSDFPPSYSSFFPGFRSLWWIKTHSLSLYMYGHVSKQACGSQKTICGWAGQNSLIILGWYAKQTLWAPHFLPCIVETESVFRDLNEYEGWEKLSWQKRKLSEESDFGSLNPVLRGQSKKGVMVYTNLGYTARCQFRSSLEAR